MAEDTRSDFFQQLVNNVLTRSADPVERSRRLTDVMTTLSEPDLMAFAFVLIREVSLTPRR